MSSFKKFVVAGLLTLLLVPAIQAELLTEKYGVNISDANMYSDGNTLFQLFNRYFADQLGTEGLYSSSNDLFNARGVDPTTDWTTSTSQIVGAFKVAMLGHEMSMIDQDGNVVANIINIGGTTNIHSANGITDLSGTTITGIEDDLHVNFSLQTSGQASYFWSSIAENNFDNAIHMVAFDITDLYNTKYGTNNSSVYMFGWEDLTFTSAYAADWDYQDFVAIMTNLEPTSSTPEPASWLIFLSGTGVASFFARRRMKKQVA